MPAIEQWVSEYGESHQNHTNKIIHWVCVPAIFFAIVGLLYSIKLPLVVSGHRINAAMIVFVPIIIYYFMLSKTLWVGMFLFTGACLLLCHIIEVKFFMPLWAFALVVFVAAWAGQFYGHKIEGKKPSFLKDIQFLLIGPAWLISFIYKHPGIKL
jgi:uncharacterized membrane protein YGL010W